MIATEHRDTYEHARQTIQRCAARDFEQHVLDEVGPHEWHCHRPGTGISSFRVIVRPGTVIVWGDLGETILRGGEAGSTLHWLTQAVHSPEYLLEKDRTGQKAFYAGDVLDYARERAEDEDDPDYAERWGMVLDEVRRAHSWGTLNSHVWADTVMEHTYDADACSAGLYPATRALWLVEALRWFVEHLPAPPEPGDDDAG